MRAIEKKRPPIFTMKKWIVLILFIIVTLVTLTILFYRSIQHDTWTEKSEITALLKAETELATIAYFEKYTWDTSSWIIKAADQNEAEFYYAWQDEQLLASIAVHDIVTEEEMEENILAKIPQAEQVTVTPGYAWDQFIWEVHYRSTEIDHYQYAFYEMSSGKFITEYTMPNKTRSF